MNYEEAGIKMISEFKKKIYQRRFAHKYFDKKGALLISTLAYLNEYMPQEQLQQRKW